VLGVTEHHRAARRGIHHLPGRERPDRTGRIPGKPPRRPGLPRTAALPLGNTGGLGGACLGGAGPLRSAGSLAGPGGLGTAGGLAGIILLRIFFFPRLDRVQPVQPLIIGQPVLNRRRQLLLAVARELIRGPPGIA
jgi:hypothetical protein